VNHFAVSRLMDIDCLNYFLDCLALDEKTTIPLPATRKETTTMTTKDPPWQSPAPTRCWVVVVMVLFFIAVGTDQEDARADIDDGLSGVVCAPPGVPGAVVAGFGGHQLVNAGLVVAVGKEMRLPQRAWVVATAVAMAESHLQVLANARVPGSLALPHDGVGVDHDSVGLFQQRASWGPVGVRMDPRGGARLFFQRLIAVPGWEGLPLTVAAQRVQASAFPDAYARWEQPANAVIGSVQGIVCGPGVVADRMASAFVFSEPLTTEINSPIIPDAGDLTTLIMPRGCPFSELAPRSSAVAHPAACVSWKVVRPC
jgi:hypothetical protein